MSSSGLSVNQQHSCVICHGSSTFTNKLFKSSHENCQNFIYHKNCLDIWLSKHNEECPICRKTISNIVIDKEQRKISWKSIFFTFVIICIVLTNSFNYTYDAENENKYIYIGLSCAFYVLVILGPISTCQIFDSQILADLIKSHNDGYGGDCFQFTNRAYYLWSGCSLYKIHSKAKVTINIIRFIFTYLPLFALATASVCMTISLYAFSNYNIGLLLYCIIMGIGLLPGILFVTGIYGLFYCIFCNERTIKTIDDKHTTYV